MKILMLTRHGYQGSSSRYRFYQYARFFKEQDIDISIESLFDDRYVENLAKYGNKQYISIISSYLRRIWKLIRFNQKNYYLIFIEKELLPWIPYQLESLLLRSNIPYVLDYDDATFHSYDLQSNPWIQSLLSRKIDLLMKQSALVICGNLYLAERAIQAGASRVEILPTVVDLAKYPIEQKVQNHHFTIGWIGSPSTTRYLESLAPVFQNICANHQARLVAIGAKYFQIGGIDLEIKKWSEATEVNDLSQIDVGIMPLDNTPWSRGKCGFKLIQYMACSKAVIASPVGVNTNIVENGVNGFLASTHQEWIDALVKLRDHRELQEQMGKNGRTTVDNRYSLEVTAPKLVELLKSVAGEV